MLFIKLGKINFDFLRDFKIWQRMVILFQFMIIPTVIIFIIFLITINKLHEIEGKIISENISSIQAAYNVEKSILNFKGLKANYLLQRDEKWLNDFERNLEYFNRSYNDAFNDARTEEERAILSTLALNFGKYQKAHERINALIQHHKIEDAINLLFDETVSHNNQIYAGCERLINKNREQIKKSELQINAYLKKSKRYGYITIVCFAFMGFMLFIVITKSILDPIKEIEKGSKFVVPGDDSGKSEMEGLKDKFELMANTIRDSQDKLIQAERKAAIGEIAAGISHELNNPLGIISGLSEMLLKKDILEKKDREMLQEVYKEAIRCKNMIGEFLDFARTPKPIFRLYDIKSIIKKTVTMFTGQDKYKDIQFVLKTGKGRHKIFIDSTQIRQVLMNLILNACEAMDYKGRLQITIDGEGNFIKIKIRDSGPGIKTENAENVFAPFYSNKSGGIGLGLAVCRDIILKHSGSIYLNYENKEGAEFIIYLPRENHGEKGA